MSDISSAEESKNKIEEASLLPVILSDEDFKIYEREFDEAFTDSRISNIAVTGPYSAGKSSVVNTWLKHVEAAEAQKGNQPKILNVSLATFDEKDSTDRPNTKKAEEALLNQLVYRIDSRKSPKSRFKKTTNNSVGRNLALSVLIASLLALSVALFNYDNFVWWKDAKDGIFLLFGVLWFLIIVVICYVAIRADVIGRFIQRLSFMGAEIEMNKASSDSAFEKCFDDIVYLLNSSETDVVIFEDLDRFDSVTLLERLRKVNLTANDCPERATRPLKFFYLVRDDIFADPHDRTKFFDFIITIIPHIDPQNAFNMFKNKLLQFGISAGDTTLYQLSLFIDDARLLAEVVRETQHYKHALEAHGAKVENRDVNKLVSIVTYKVLCPKDFAMLQTGKGYMHALIDDGEARASLIGALTEEINSEIDAVHVELQAAKRWQHFDKDELTLLYGGSEIGRSGYVHLPSSNTTGEILGKIRENKSAANQFDKLHENLLETNDEYKKRVDAISSNAEHNISNLERKILGLNGMKEELKREKISNLLRRANAEDKKRFFENALNDTANEEPIRAQPNLSANGKRLIRFLVENGLVDESYEYFISVYHEGSLTKEDADFVIGILQGTPVDAEYEINNGHLVTLRLDPNILSRPSARNYSLFRFLLAKKPEEKLDGFLGGIFHDRDYTFLLNFVNSKHFTTKVFAEVKSVFPQEYSPIVRILKNRSIAAESKRIFCNRAISAECSGFSNEEIIAIRNFANNDEFFLDGGEKIKTFDREKGLRAIGYCALNIKLSNKNYRIYYFVYTQGMYVANYENICQFGKRFQGCESTDLIDLGNALFAKRAGTLGGHVESHMSDYIASISQRLANNAPNTVLGDDENTIAWIMNHLESDAENDKVTEQLRIYLDRIQRFSVSDISRINTSKYRSLLLDTDTAACNIDNILGYYVAADNTIDQSLGQFVNRNHFPSGINHKLVVQQMGNDDFLNHVISSPVIQDEEVNSLTSEYGAYYKSFGISNLKDSRIEILIRNGIITMTADNLRFIRQYHPDCIASFVKKSQSEYLSIVLKSPIGTGFTPMFDEAECLVLFNTGKLEPKTELNLIDSITHPVRLNKNYSDTLSVRIIETHFHSEDFALLPDYYSGSDSELNKAITGKLASEWRTIVNTKVILSTPLLCRILEKLASAQDPTIPLIVHQINDESSSRERSEIRSICHSAGLTSFEALLEGKPVSLPNDSDTKSLMNILIRLGMCSEKSGRINNDGSIQAIPLGFRRK